jgi:hypothetical protein
VDEQGRPWAGPRDTLSNGLNYLLKFSIAYDSQINCSTSSTSEPAAATRMVCPRLGPGPTAAGREREEDDYKKYYKWFGVTDILYEMVDDMKWGAARC